jgi:hypothetical protein
MRVCYVDTSCLVAIAFDEPRGDRLAERLATFDLVLSSTLLEAELRSALAREGVQGADRLLSAISWILPDRRLTPEIDRVLGAGYARGADLQHLACALFAAESPHDLPFLTLDVPQGELASALGFPD